MDSHGLPLLALVRIHTATHVRGWFMNWFAFVHSFLIIKIIMGIQLLSYATRRRAGMEAREAADVVNDFGREPIGEGKEEQARAQTRRQ